MVWVIPTTISYTHTTPHTPETITVMCNYTMNCLLLALLALAPLAASMPSATSRPATMSNDLSSQQILSHLRTSLASSPTVEHSLAHIRNSFCLAFKNILAAQVKQDEAAELSWAQTAIKIRDQYVELQRQRRAFVPDQDPFYGQKELIPVCFPKLEDLVSAKRKQVASSWAPSVNLISFLFWIFNKNKYKR